MSRHRKIFTSPASQEKRRGFEWALRNAQNANKEDKISGVEGLSYFPEHAATSYPILRSIREQSDGELRAVVDAAIRKLLPHWVHWNIYHTPTPNAVQELKQLKQEVPLSEAAVTVLIRASEDLEVPDEIYQSIIELLSDANVEVKEKGNRTERNGSQSRPKTSCHVNEAMLRRFERILAYRSAYLSRIQLKRKRSSTPSLRSAELKKRLRYTRRHPEPSLYPRPFPDQQASALGIRIEEFSQQELRFFDSNTSDLLLVWNRSTCRSRPTLVESGERETLGLEQALDHAKARLHTERVGVGKRVVLLNITDGGTETYKITGSHIVASPEEDTLQFNSPLGSQIVGLTEGTEITAKVPKGEIRYLIQKIS